MSSPSLESETGARGLSRSVVWLDAVIEAADSPELEAVVFQILELCQEAEILKGLLGVTGDEVLPSLAGEVSSVIDSKRQVEASREDDLSAVDWSDMERRLRDQIRRLAVEAYHQKAISRGRLFDLARKIGVSGDQLIEAAGVGRDT